MGVTYDGTTNFQCLNYGANFGSLATKSWLIQYNISNLNGTSTSEIFGKASASGTLSGKGWGLFADHNLKALVFFQYWSTASGGLVTWTTPNNSLTTGKHLMALSYDWGSTSNNPVIKIDDANQSLTQNTAPSGAATESVTDEFIVGAYRSDRPSTPGTDMAFCMFNRIITAAEMTDAYNSRLMLPNYNGLVFAPNLCGAKGLQTFDGTTLTSSNIVYDVVNGLAGTPNGSPVGAGDTYLNINAR